MISQYFPKELSNKRYDGNNLAFVALFGHEWVNSNIELAVRSCAGHNNALNTY